MTTPAIITEEDQAVADRIPPEGASGPVIRFHNQRDMPWGHLSNFYPAAIKINGLVYPTSEHFFQAMKFFGTSEELIERIRLTETPGVAAEIGRDRAHPLRSDWDAVKEQLMFHAIVAKFSQHPLLLYSLMQTRFTMLVEWNHKDLQWASGTDFLEGKNRLGVLLMQVRELFRQYGGNGIPFSSSSSSTQNAEQHESDKASSSCAFLTQSMEKVRSRVAHIIATSKKCPFYAGLYQGKTNVELKGVPYF
jgi:ribA/ribD-fused uncharacterized protein